MRGLQKVMMAAAALAWVMASNARAIDFANILVVQHDTGNNATSVSFTSPVGTDGLLTDAGGSNRGDYAVHSTANTNNVAGGLLISSVSQNGRDNGEGAGVRFATSAVDITGTNWYMSVNDAPSNGEYNINVSAAYFPFAEGWIGGHVRNDMGTNGGSNNTLIGNGIALGSSFVDNGGGQSTVTIPGVNSQTDGVLLVNHGKNEANFALSRANANGSWTLFVHDNAAQGSSYEQDPVAFVYVPKTAPNQISGRIAGDGTILLSSAAGAFTATSAGTGQVQLEFPGYTPYTGVLIISPEGGVSNNVDNIVTYETNGTGFRLQTRDLPQSPPTLQNVGSEAMASFIFLPLPKVRPNSQFAYYQNGSDFGAGVYNSTVDIRISDTNGTVVGAGSSTYALDGGVPNEQALIRFDDIVGLGAGQIPQKAVILKARLQISTSIASNAQTGGSYAVSQMLLPFDTSTVFADFGANGPTEGDGEIGAFASFIPGAVQGREVNFDVTSIVQAWANGEPNFGFNIQAFNTSDGWAVYATGEGAAELRPLLFIEFAPVPEPSTALALIGAGGLLLIGRRRRNCAA